MPVTPINTIKGWFANFLKPTQEQFWNWMDSYWHRTDSIPQANITDLVTTLNGLASQISVDSLKSVLYPYKIILNADGTYVLPAGFLMDKIIITPVGASTIKVGTTLGGDEVMIQDDIAAGEDKVVSMDMTARVNTTIYFTGITSATTILIYRRTLTSIN